MIACCTCKRWWFWLLHAGDRWLGNLDAAASNVDVLCRFPRHADRLQQEKPRVLVQAQGRGGWQIKIYGWRCFKDVKEIRREEHAEGLTGDGEEQSCSRCFGPLNFHVRQYSGPLGSASTALGSAQLAGLLSWPDRKRQAEIWERARWTRGQR